jgi:L-seryl-tRNA(Ser) seleniumtransferase
MSAERVQPARRASTDGTSRGTADAEGRSQATPRSVSSGPPPRPPSVDAVLVALRPPGKPSGDGRAVANVARAVVDEERLRLAGGDEAASVDALADRVRQRMAALLEDRPPAAINATGVIVHTNLGRAPWPAEAIEAARLAAGSLLLEIDRSSGRRGARYRLAEDHLIALTDAADALVTNNNAAALALACGLAGRGRGIAVSRGELVEIGGGVRIPEIIRRAGAKLVEVGTTNRTRAADFEAPLADGSARIVLRVHPSNFHQSGFTEAPDPADVAALAHRHGAIVIDDLGSGALLPTERFGLAHEPTPAERLSAGADLVTFSGDKLVGGPQAGFIVGRSDLIARIRRDPLARAMRPDKVTLAAVAATLALYRAGLAAERVPVWRMISAPLDDLRARAAVIATAIGPSTEVIAVDATVGGGSLPGEMLPSVAVAVGRDASPGRSVDRLLAALRAATPAVIGRASDDQALFDVRTVDPADDVALVAAIRAALSARRATERRRGGRGSAT